MGGGASMMLFKIFLSLLFILLVGDSDRLEAQSGFLARTNCNSITAPITNGAVCIQMTTASGRTAGKIYKWTGSAWIRADRDLENWTVATLPASPVNGDMVLVTDGMTAISCELGLGGFQVPCVYDAPAGHWVPLGSSGTVSDWGSGRVISDAVDANTCVKIYNSNTGQGWCVYSDSSGNAVIATLLPSDYIIKIPAGKIFCITDSADACILTIDEATGGLSGATAGVLVRKTSNESVTASTTLQNDDILLFAIAANEVRTFEMYVAVDSGVTPDFKFDFTGPAGVGGQFFTNAVSPTSQGVPLVYAISSNTDDIDVDGFSPQVVFLYITGVVVNGATAGTIQFRWAQKTSDGGNTIVQANSYIIHKSH